MQRLDVAAAEVARMLLLLSFTLLLAQDSTRAHGTLELRDAYRTAEQRNPRLVAARALADAARARTASARKPPDPQLQLGVMNYALPEWRAMDAVGMTQLQAMQMLPLAGKLGAAGRVADLSAFAEADRAQDVRWDVRARVAKAFYDVYAADRSLAIDRETLRLLQDVRHIAEAMYRVGDGRQADVLRADVEIARMVQDTIRMTAMRSATAARLAGLLNGGGMEQSPILPEFPDTTPALDTLNGIAFANRPMLHAGENELNAAAARVALARKDIWPDLTVGVQLGQRNGMAGAERMASVMVGATIPVFARSRQFRMRDEAAAMQQMARAELDAMRAETMAAVVEAHADLVRARTLAGLYQTTLLPQAEAATESALASYRVGRVDFMTVLDNRMGVNRYRKELVALEAEEGKAWAELEMLMGRELFTSRSRSAATAAGRAP
ncbi:MAG TPA: TolC family protein [Gemmatimonadaceae bacterium]|nr:TolC family protein [Gemmatimonadaceae bacterium]